MTAVDELRAAAAKIRARAEVATEGPWRADHPEYPEKIYGGSHEHIGVIAGSRWNGEANVFDNNDDAYHIATWHPGIALIIADWLDTEAHAVDSSLSMYPDTDAEQLVRWPLRVARAINETKVA